MSKRRPIQGQPKEIMYFLVENLGELAGEDESLIPDLRDELFSEGISVLEFDTANHSLAVINETLREVPLEDIYQVFDSFGLKSYYSRSEFV